MIGNAHIDPIWLWRWQAGMDEAIASFSSAAQRCEEYPDFIYTRGEAWLYRQVEQAAPELFARVRELIADGRWHVTGGQWVQPDANAPTEAGWRRQFTQGRRYFQDRFGVTPTVAYNVDTFGHPATLPDILASVHCRAYVFQRPDRYQLTLPAQTFRWQGRDGGEVIGFRIAPVYTTRTDDLYGQIMLSVEAADPALGHTMCFYGVGNHGGGPTKGNIEYILSHAHAFEGIELRFSTPEAFIDAVEPQWPLLPLVTEELQHCFPGCYSVMHDIKQEQRQGEHLLEQAAWTVESLAADPAERETLHQGLDRAWEDLLFTQFHDILAGSSVPAAYPSVRAMQGRARITAEEIIAQTTRRWARRSLPAINQQQLVLYNADPAPWEGLAEVEPFLDFDHWGNRWLSDLEGLPLPYQRVQPEAHMHITRLVVPVRVEAGGAAQLLVRDDAPVPFTFQSDLEVSATSLANAHLRLDLDRYGIGALRAGNEQVLGGEGLRLHLRADHTDTWTFLTDRFREPVEEVFHTSGWVVEETGPLRARVRAEGLLGGSPIRWTLTLHAGDPRLYVRLEVNFCEHYRLLQLAASLPAAPDQWIAGLAGGSVERQPTATEWPVQGWAQAGGNLALITADAYSASLEGSLWQWTLLRSPQMAWGGEQADVYAGRDFFSDQGPQVFNFIVRADRPRELASFEQEARQQARPLIVFDRYEGMNRPAWGSETPRHLYTDADRYPRPQTGPGSVAAEVQP
jgi:alpha-mannosidase